MGLRHESAAKDVFASALAGALRSAPALPLDPDVVRGCIDSRRPVAAHAERQFRQAFEDSLAGVPRAERSSALNGVTGHIAESVVEVLLEDAGWIPVEHFIGPFSGGHGIDLAMMTPAMSNIFAVEVKGTLQPRRWPRLGRGDLPQLSADWLGKLDNPGVVSMGVEPERLAVLAILVQFSRREWRAAWSLDAETAHPLGDPDELAELV